MLAQLFQQHLVGGLKAAQMNLLILNDGGIQHAAYQPFRQRIRHAHVKEEVRLFAIVNDIQHLLAQGEHLVRIAEHQLTQLARLNATPFPLKKLSLQALFQGFDLPGNSLWRQVKRFCRPHDRALFINVPEVIKMVVIQMRHRVFSP